jgi:ATP-dependent RNA helicase DeaD
MNDEAQQITFADLGLRKELLDTLGDLGYEAPTPIQEKTIPVLLEGRDLIGQAQTGTGKTAAFALPILQKLDLSSRDTQALVLAPTRELAMQVAEAFHTYAKKLGNVSVLPVYGGASIVLQMKHLARGAQIVVGTPGRLIDHLDRKTLKLGTVRAVVLDEADEMLKMGFLEDVERILSELATPRQVVLFSATMPEEVARIAQRHLVNPKRIEIERKALTAPAIEQRFLNVSEGQKLDVLTQILEIEEAEAVLIFRRTKNGAAELAEKLEARGFPAAAMHGDMNQQMRENVIRRLRNGQIEIVVATDVAARGLDVEQITHVINYDVPHDVEVYVHRIGRTGRAGRSGVATLFITPRERRMMREIERFTGSPIKPMKMPTASDVAERRISILKDSLRKTLQEGDLELYVNLIEQLAEEGPHDVVDVAADGTAHRERDDRPREERSQSDEPKVRLSMSVGKRDGIRPADVVGSIANEADVPGRDIGPIEIHDEVTYVSVPPRYVDAILEKVGRARFRGRAVNMRVAGENEEAPRPRRDEGGFAPRGERKPYAPREDKSYRKPYAPREDKPYAARTERKPYAPREDKPYAPREDKPYRKPYAPREERPYTPRENKFAPRDDRGGSFKPRPAGAARPGAKPFAKFGQRDRPKGGGGGGKFRK